MKMLKVKVESMEEREKLCILNVDEMSIKPCYVYDSVTQSYCGTVTLPLSKKLQKKRIKEFGKYEEKKELAYHAFSIVLVCLTGNWEQFIAFQFTGYAVEPKAVCKWLEYVISEVCSIGLNLKGITMDNCAANWKI